MANQMPDGGTRGYVLRPHIENGVPSEGKLAGKWNWMVFYLHARPRLSLAAMMLNIIYAVYLLVAWVSGQGGVIGAANRAHILMPHISLVMLGAVFAVLAYHHKLRRRWHLLAAGSLLAALLMLMNQWWILLPMILLQLYLFWRLFRARIVRKPR